MHQRRRAILSTPKELREQSQRLRDAARTSADAETKRQLAARAAALAKITEALAREGEVVRSERVEHYKRLLAGPPGGQVQQIVRELMGQQRF
jgi:putative ubiquitin-RnfH superfamily antitoxin RatB of RatAB toxin-antitoxin module